MKNSMFEKSPFSIADLRPLDAHEMTSVSGGGDVANVVVGGSLGAVGGFFAGRIAGVALGATIGGPVGALIGLGISVGFGLANSGGGGSRYLIGPKVR